MYFGEKKTQKRLNLGIFTCIIIWIISFANFLILIFGDFHSSTSSLALFPRPLYFLSVLFLFYSSIGKTECLLAEINNNLDVFKMFYLLLMDIKSKYNLTDQNYNRLAFFSFCRSNQ